MDQALFDTHYDRLVRLVYQGVLEQPPWHSALPALREALDAQVVSLVLRPPSADDRGVILNCVRPDPQGVPRTAPLADPADWEVTAYREQFFSLDPFVNLPLDRVIALEDILSDAELTASDYYLHYLQPIGLFRILGLDTGEPEGLLVRLRCSRRREEQPFDDGDRALLQALALHLRQAALIYDRLSRMASERDIYSGAVDQLSVATIILDDKGRVLNTNALASALLKDAGGLSLRGGQLQLASRDANQALQDALASVLRAQQAGRASVVRALRVTRPEGRPPWAWSSSQYRVQRAWRARWDPAQQFSSAIPCSAIPPPSRYSGNCSPCHRRKPMWPSCWPAASASAKSQRRRTSLPIPPGHS